MRDRFAALVAFARRHSIALLAALYFALVVAFEGPLSRDVQLMIAAGFFGWAAAHVLAALATIRIEGRARTVLREARCTAFHPSPISVDVAAYRYAVFGGEIMAIARLAELYGARELHAECDATMGDLCDALERLEERERAEVIATDPRTGAP